MRKTFQILALAVAGCFASTALQAAIILETDFSGTSVDASTPLTMNEVSWTTLGVNPPSSDLVATNVIANSGNGELLDPASGDSTGFFIVDTNTGNGGAWTTSFDFSTLADDIALDSFDIDWANFNNNGIFQPSERNNIFVVTLEDADGNVLFSEAQLTETVNSAVDNSGAVPIVPVEMYDLTGITLSANTDYTFTISAVEDADDADGNMIATIPGSQTAADAFTLNGTVLNATAVPEPSSFAILGLGGLLMVSRRRR